MENRYPLFAGGRILKKESLWDLRDYLYGGLQLQYADYTDGVIKGCKIRVEGSELIVGTGIMKCGGFIYLIQEETRVPYKAENCTTVLKAAFEPPKEDPDYQTYAVRFFLDHETECKRNQIELCRFHLREGSVLRDYYKNFSDMGTEYDTVNLIHATVAGRGKKTICLEVVRRYVDELQVQQGKELADYAFCYAVKNAENSVDKSVIAAYLDDKKQGCGLEKIFNWSNEQVFQALDDILFSRSNRDSSYADKLIYVE